MDLEVKTFLDDSFENAELNLGFKIKSTLEASYINFILSREGENCLEIEKVNIVGEKLELAYNLENVALWSAEEPNLYELNIAVYDRNGDLLEVLNQDIGFRRFEMKNGLMLLNGKRIVFKGVNRHDFSSKFGRSVSKAEIKKDIITMKKNNINAIRTSHYPNNSYLYELCDKYGLYLIDENNMETHGSWTLYSKTKDFEYIVPKDNKI